MSGELNNLRTWEESRDVFGLWKSNMVLDGQRNMLNSAG